MDVTATSPHIDLVSAEVHVDVQVRFAATPAHRCLAPFVVGGDAPHDGVGRQPPEGHKTGLHS